MEPYVDYVMMLGAYVEGTLRDRFDVEVRDETGALSMQAAAIAFLLLAIAVAVGAIMMTKATSQAENIPDVVNTP